MIVDNFKKYYIWIILSFVIISAATFSGLPLHQLLFPSDSPITEIPWYFIRQHYIDGLCAMVGLLITLLIAFMIRKKYSQGAYSLVVFGMLWLGSKVVDVAVINIYCANVLDSTRALTSWKNSHEFMTSLEQWKIIFFIVLFLFVILISMIYKKQELQKQAASSPGFKMNVRLVVLLLLFSVAVFVFLGKRFIDSRDVIYPPATKETAVSLYYKSKALIGQGKKEKEEALKIIEQSIQMDPHFGKAHLLYAYLLNYLNYPSEKTQQEDLKAIECGMHKENMAIAYAGLSIDYRNNKEYEKAKQAALKAIDYDPTQDRAYYILGEYDRYQKEYDKAINNYLKSIQLCDKNDKRQQAFVHRLIGLAYFSLNLFESAVKEYQIAIEIDPKFTNPKADTYADLVEAYAQLKKYDELIEQAKKSLAMKPTAQVYYQLALAYLAKNDIDSANTILEKLKDLDKGMYDKVKILLEIK